MLFLIATPIGNLADISERALDTLRMSDLILCEDTRHSGILLRHFAIEKPLLSFHEFNEKKQEESILKQLEEGKFISLISDAGTPLISDPGYHLVQGCIERNIPIAAIPGPCSPILALLVSGFPANCFQFIGFLPREKGALKEALRRSLFYSGTTIAFESPKRLLATLNLLQNLSPARPLAVARELTKTFEECRRGLPIDLIAHFKANEPRGEIILLIHPGSTPTDDTSVEEIVAILQELHGLSLMDAIKAAAKLKGLPKSTVYRQIHSS